ncbi:hypothetical protein Tco_0990449 [Tanacetum coccineum]|uniref:Uncharacterized protein n=1 Tax=Tanacetum coccineum TaxID=301880 RepID=A0ABQ5EXN2_9ASTR
MTLPRSKLSGVGSRQQYQQSETTLRIDWVLSKYRGRPSFASSEFEVGMEKTYSPKTEGGNGRLSILIVRVEAVM